MYARPGLERLQHLLLLDARGLRELGDRRRAAELHRLLLDDLRELDVQLLEAARNAHGPALVAEVALDLADDVRRRVRRQLDAAVDVEAVDRLDQADTADLDEVVELLAAVRVAPRERADEREVLLDQLLARGEVALLVVAAQQRLVGGPGHPVRLRAREHVALVQLDPRAAVALLHRDLVDERLEQPAQAERCCPLPAGARPRSVAPSGPIDVSIASGVTRRRMFTSPSTSFAFSSCSSSESSASWRSSSASSVRSCRDAMPADDEAGDRRERPLARNRDLELVRAVFIGGRRRSRAARLRDRARAGPPPPCRPVPPRDSRDAPSGRRRPA